MFKRSSHHKLTWPLWFLPDTTADIGILLETFQRCWVAYKMKGFVMIPCGPLPEQLLMR